MISKSILKKLDRLKREAAKVDRLSAKLEYLGFSDKSPAQQELLSLDITSIGVADAKYILSNMDKLLKKIEKTLKSVNNKIQKTKPEHLEKAKSVSTDWLIWVADDDILS